MPENFERYSEQEALEQASKIQQMVESGEVTSYAEAEKNLGVSLENDLAPELREKVMNKIDDIDKPGVAYHVTKGPPRLPELRSILETGLVTWSVVQDAESRVEANRDEASLPREIRTWTAKKIKRWGHLGGGLWFNIVGRSRDTDKRPGSTPEIEQMGLYSFEGQVAILFNIDDFTEQETGSTHHELPRKRYTYNPERRKYELDEEKPDSAYGYFLSDRISPRKFQGVVLRTHSILRNDENKPPGAVWPEKLHEVVKTMLEINKEHPERILPIYDELGNLLWPERLSREEIKNIVSQREVNNSDAEEI